MKIEQRTIDEKLGSLIFHVHHFPGTTCTVAIAVLPDGFVAGTGKSACIDPSLFDKGTGYDIAMANARADAGQRLWELEGYHLKQTIKPDTAP